MSLAVGIDLGTTNSCVALYKEGQVEIIETVDEKTTTPSHVYYDDDGTTIVGENAVKRSAIKPQNGVFDSKRFIGRKHDDPAVQDYIKTLPFTIGKAANHDGFVVEIVQQGQKQHLRPEEVSAEILKKLRSDVCRHLEQEVFDAVITVPANFTSAQKGATRAAAKLAGFNVLKLINEPTAAALAFAQENDDDKRTILVYDLGGGTFDVSLIDFQNGEGTVKCTKGDPHLGGRDFDNNLMTFFIQEIKKVYGSQVITSSTNDEFRVAMRRMRLECESIKKTLSESTTATLNLDGFFGIDVTMTITRQQFEDLNEALISKTLVVLQNALDEAGLGLDQIDDVILVGGSTKIPKIQEVVKDFFKGKAPNKSVNPNEAVAIGAAIQAALCNDNPLQDTDATPLVDVTALSLGVAEMGTRMDVIIKRSTKIPASGENTYETLFDNQTEVEIGIYEGESDKVADNYSLGTFTVEGLSELPAGSVKICVIMELDDCGLLKVKAEESSQGNKKDLEIKMPKDRLTDEQIENMIKKFAK